MHYERAPLLVRRMRFVPGFAPAGRSRDGIDKCVIAADMMSLFANSLVDGMILGPRHYAGRD